VIRPSSPGRRAIPAPRGFTPLPFTDTDPTETTPLDSTVLRVRELKAAEATVLGLQDVALRLDRIEAALLEIQSQPPQGQNRAAPPEKLDSTRASTPSRKAN
jgi:hypothetical protein